MPKLHICPNLITKTLPMHLNSLELFFSNYRVIARQSNPKHQEYHDQYHTIFKGLSAQLHEIRQQEERVAPSFNIFNIIKMGSYEAITHTPFLAHLLDPRGSHAQGDLFYNIFLDHLPTPRKVQFRTSSILVSPEHWTNDGYIDIFIRSQDPQKPFCIVLENKIDASDQPKQMSRYYEYALQIMGDKGKILLVYLTKFGKDLSPDSMGSGVQEDLRKIDCLHSVTYNGFISSFLKDAIPQIKAPTVRHTVEQYLQLISAF